MRKFASHKLRLAELEGRRGESSVILRFPDGSTRGVKVSRSHELQLLLDSFKKARAHPPPAPEGESSPPPPPEPKTESDSLLDAMCQAESIEAPRLFQTVFGICQTIKERKEKQK